MTSDTYKQATKPWAIALLILIPFAANLPALSGLVNCDPETIYSGLGHNFLPGLIPGNACFLDPTVGYITQPLGYLSAQDWLHGIIPWWNPYSGVGMPLAAEMQNESFFLPFVLLLNFKSGWLYQRIIFQCLAGFFTYAFLRSRQLHEIAALTGGLIFSLNSSFFLHAGAASGPIFCLPLMMLGVERAVIATSARRHGGWSCIAAGLALSIYAGFPEIAFFDGLLVAIWTMFRTLQLSSADRPIFIRKICLGAGIGIAVTAPVIIPFLQYLSSAELASHGGQFAGSVLPDAAAPIAIFPYIYGALGLAVPPVLQSITGDLWVKFGGWIGCLPFLLALVAIIRIGQDRPARFVFAGWLAIWLARDFNYFDIKILFNLVPGVAHADAIRFSWISREFAAYSLAAYGIDDLLKRCKPTLLQLVFLAGIFGFCVIASLATAFSVLRIWFASQPDVEPYATIYLGLCFLACAGSFYAFATGRRTGWVATALVTGAFAIFLVPQLAAPRGGKLDMPAINKIQSVTSFARVYTAGPFGPNFPARYAISSINDSQLPAPKLWTDFITDDLFPGGNVIDFTGNQKSQIYGLISNLANYQAIGVKYILTSPGQTLSDWRPPPENVIAPSGFVLLVGQSAISGMVAPSASDLTVNSVSLFIGTVHGDSTGPLSIQLCSGVICASGEINTAAIQDDTRATFRLDQPLRVSKSLPLLFRISHASGAWVAVFMTGGSNGMAAGIMADNPDDLNFAKSHAAPPVHYVYARLTPSISFDVANFPLIYQDKMIAIHEIPAPSPYASISDRGCALQILSRQLFKTNCKVPAELTRRELFFSGWQAQINGHETLITNTNNIFQAISVPAGPANIRFTYEPLHTHIACLIAILAILAWVFLGFRSRGNMMSAL